MKKEELAAAIKEISHEKNIDESDVLESLESALGAAYRKEYRSGDEIIECNFDISSGKMEFYQVWEVIDDEEEEYNKKRQMPLKKAQELDEDAEVDSQVEKKLETKDKFGRIAAQTAKQVILQQVREAERDQIFETFKEREGEVVNGTVQQIENKNVIVDLDKANGMLFSSEQIPDENYRIGQRLKVYIKEVEDTSKGALIKLSRTHPKLISYLFKTEVPEIESGAVEIKDIVREAGRRTKMSVVSNQEGVDPIGSCVGQRGTRVQAVLSEIGNEKIDIIPHDEDPATYIKNALSPAKIIEIKLDEKNSRAKVYVDEDQLSLAIGKQGQNVRLASKLTGYEIDIVNKGEEVKEKADKSKEKDLEEGKGKEGKKEKKETEEDKKDKEKEDKDLKKEEGEDKTSKKN